MKGISEKRFVRFRVYERINTFNDIDNKTKFAKQLVDVINARRIIA